MTDILLLEKRRDIVMARINRYRNNVMNMKAKANDSKNESDKFFYKDLAVEWEKMQKEQEEYLAHIREEILQICPTPLC